MLIKLGVTIEKLERPIRRWLTIIDGLFKKYGDEGVITSTYEGNHMPSSLHYRNLAIDFRKPTHQDYDNIIEDLKKTLGGDYDIILKPDHIHIEYDPKEGK